MYTEEMKILRRPLSHYVALTAFFFLMVLVLPSNSTVMATYNLTSLQYHILLLLYVLPFIGIWFAAFFAYDRLLVYARVIKSTPEGPGFAMLAKGCGWLAYSLPIPILVGIILSAVSDAIPSFKAMSTIFVNYLFLILPLIGFSILGTSARKLSDQAKIRMHPGEVRAVIAAFVLLGVFYCYSILKQFDLMATNSAVTNQYFLPLSLVIITLVIPYLYSWFTGLLAAYEIVLFSRQSKGVLYRQSLTYVAVGIATVIASSIALQYINTITPQTGDLSINVAFATSYVIGFIAALGYVFIAIGAVKLKRIEEA